MKVWLITVGEPLPNDGNGDRLLRTAILSEAMSQNGHDVLWWTSAFDHSRKRHRSLRNERLQLTKNFQIQTLYSVGYRHNVSIRRVIDQIGVARQFRRLADKESPPEIILCSLPTLELCDAAVNYGARQGIPVILDVRDLWPDLFLDLLPKVGQPVGRLLLTPMFRQVQRVCRKATAICGITDEFVRWGLNHGSREKSDWDRTFPLAYRESSPPAQELAEAKRYWRNQGLTDDQFIACFFGVMGRHSDLETVIAAARKIESMVPNLRVVLCGLGPNFERCQRLAAGSPTVLLPGWMNAAQIWTLLRMSQVGLAPFANCENYTRNLPNKPIEYLSAGLPIVTCLKGVLSDVIRKNDCGVIYSDQDPAALADVLLKLHSTRSDVRRMSTNAQKVYDDKYRASVVYAAMERYLQEVATASISKQLAA